MGFDIPNIFGLNSPASFERMNENFTYIENYYNGGLGGENLQDGILTNAEIENTSVPNEKFGDAAITTAKIEADSIVNANYDLEVFNSVDLSPEDGYGDNARILRAMADNEYYPSFLVGSFTQRLPLSLDWKEVIKSWSEIFTVGDPGFEIAPVLVYAQILPDDISNNVHSRSVTIRVRGTSTSNVKLWLFNTNPALEDERDATIVVWVLNSESPLRNE